MKRRYKAIVITSLTSILSFLLCVGCNKKDIHKLSAGEAEVFPATEVAAPSARSVAGGISWYNDADAEFTLSTPPLSADEARAFPATEVAALSARSVVGDISWYNDVDAEFTLSTPRQLLGFAKLVGDRNDFKGKTVRLGADIMLNDTANWQGWAKSPPTNVWVVHYTDKFDGCFDGGGFKVSGVYVNSASGGAGLFGELSDSGTIKNLGVTASYTEGLGGLVGISSGSIINCYFVGKVVYIDNIYQGAGHAGGLVGFNSGTISGCYSAGTVEGESGDLGGLVGFNLSMIKNSCSTASVTGTESDVGGLVGSNSTKRCDCEDESKAAATREPATILNCYSTGAVKGGYNVGGLAGFSQQARIKNSYSTGSVDGIGKHVEGVGGLVGQTKYGEIENAYAIGTVNADGEYAGGLVGHNKYCAIRNSYSIGAVTGTQAVGGFVGHNVYFYNDLGAIRKSYYNKETSGQRSGYGELEDVEDNNESKGSTVVNIKGKTTAEMKKRATFVGWDFNKVWGIDGSVNDGYPYLLEMRRSDFFGHFP